MISVDEISRQVADLCPEDHLKAFLKRDTRPDGRSLEEFRPIIIAPNVLNRFVAVKSNAPKKIKNCRWVPTRETQSAIVYLFEARQTLFWFWL